MFELLSHIDGLESLKYSTMVWSEDEEKSQQLPERFWARAGLLVSSTRMLRYLIVEEHSGTGAYMGSLRPFQVLRRVEASSEFLIGNMSHPHKLEDVLPASIEDVTITKCYVAEASAYRELILDMLLAKDACLPNFQSLELDEISGDTAVSVQSNRALSIDYQESGIALSIST